MTDQFARLKTALADRYEVEHEVGQGGMAIVYLARDPKHQRPVAIKVLHPQLTETMAAARFLREVTIAANLTHPHILPLHDSGEADGFLFYVMPYIEGESLRTKLAREGKLSVAETARILQQVADALSYAHNRGIVHRDIKPENIMLTGRNAVVMDFGIAKAVTAATDSDQTESLPGLTSVGVVIGTPAYMAPEQAMGDPNVDHRVDIYALGVMAYEMLTGRQPFTGQTAQEVLTAQITQSPDPMTAADVSVPPALADLISKSLEKNPENRWQRVEELLPRLESSGVGETAFLPRRGTGRMIGVVAATVIVLSAAFWFFRMSAGNQASEVSTSSIAVLPFADLSTEGDNEFFSDGLTDELITSLSMLSGLRVAGRTSVFWFKGKNEDIQTIGEQLKVGAILDGSVRRAGNKIRVVAQLIKVEDGFQLWSNTYDRELDDIFAVQEDVAQSIATALKVELSEGEGRIVESGTNDVSAYNAYLLGRFHWNKRTAQDLLVAASHFEEAIATDSNFADAWSGLAGSYVLFPPYGVEALSWQEAITRAEHAAQRAIALDSTSAEAHASLAIVLDAKWDWSGAEHEFQQAIALNPRYPTAHQWYAIYLVGVDRVEEGLAEIRRAQELDLLSSIIGAWVALILDVAGHGAEATAQFEKVVELHPNAPHVRRDAWLHFLRNSDFESASDQLRQYLELTESPFADQWPDGVRDPDTRTATLREIADSTSADFKMSTDLRVILGDKDAALASLEDRLASPDRLRDSAGAIRAYILSDELRREPRFQALLRNMQIK